MFAKPRPGHIRGDESSVIRELAERQGSLIRQHDVDIDTMGAERSQEPRDVEPGGLGQLLAQVRDVDARWPEKSEGPRGSPAPRTPREHS